MRCTPVNCLSLLRVSSGQRCLKVRAWELVCAKCGELPDLGPELHPGNKRSPCRRCSSLIPAQTSPESHAGAQTVLQQQSAKLTQALVVSLLSRARKQGFCSSEMSPERVERPAGSQLKMMGTGETWSGCRCPLLFLLLLLGNSCHMLHGQGKGFTLRSPQLKCHVLKYFLCVLTNPCI